MLRTTNDTNVWVSGINWPLGNAGRVLVALREGRYVHVTSLEILFEIARVLREYFDFSDEDAYQWFQEIGELSEVVLPVERIHAIDADPTDDKFLECALTGRCDYIVSGDRHLLDLRSYRNVEILTVAAFLERLAGPLR